MCSFSPLPWNSCPAARVQSVGRSGALDRALAPCYIPPGLEGPGVLGMGVT
jgi:hypothetical protein